MRRWSWLEVATALADAQRDPDAFLRKFREVEKRRLAARERRQRIVQLERDCEALMRQLRDLEADEVATSQAAARLRREAGFLFS